MLSSWQIAALHAQQGQAFSAQQQAVQPLSAQMPQAYGGIGGPGVMSSPFGNSAYGGGPGPGFNYGASSSGGSAFGNAGTAIAGGIGQSFSGGLGMMGAMRGFSAGGGFGALKAGNFGSLAGSMLLRGGIGMGIGALGQHFFGTAMEGAQEQQGLERTLGRYQFTNPQAFGGRGFSRQDQMGIGDTMRQISRDPAMLTSFGELNQIADKMGQMGLTQGVKSVDDFTKKFTSMVKTLQGMAKQIGTTMEGALQAFGESRASGFYSDSDIKANVLRTRMMSATTGMTQEQSSAAQRWGGEASHARGGSRRGGAIAATRTAMQLGTLNRMGVISNDDIVEMTGKEGADGLQDMAARMQDLGYRMARSSVGTAATLALGEVVDGQYTGKMDPELVEKYRRGEIGKGELMSLAHSKASGRGAKLSFAAHRKRLTTEMVNATGVEGQAAILQRLLGDRGWDDPNAQSLVMQKFGMSEEDANLLQKMMPNLKTAGLEMSMQTRQEAKAIEKKQIMGDAFSLDALKKRISTKISHYTEDWIKDIGTSIRDTLSSAAEDYMADAAGRLMDAKDTNLGRHLARVSTGSGGTEQERLGIKRLIEGEKSYQGDMNRERYVGSDTSLLTDVLGIGSTKATVSEKTMDSLRRYDPSTLHKQDRGWTKRDIFTTTGKDMEELHEKLRSVSSGALGKQIDLSLDDDPEIRKDIEAAFRDVENTQAYIDASQQEKVKVARDYVAKHVKVNRSGLSSTNQQILDQSTDAFDYLQKKAYRKAIVAGPRWDDPNRGTDASRESSRPNIPTSGMFARRLLEITLGPKGSFNAEEEWKEINEGEGFGGRRRDAAGKQAQETELEKLIKADAGGESYFKGIMQEVEGNTSAGKLWKGFTGSVLGGSFDKSGKSLTKGDPKLLALMRSTTVFSPDDKEYLKKSYGLTDDEIKEWDGPENKEKRAKWHYTASATGLRGEGAEKLGRYIDANAREQSVASIEAYKARGVEMINTLVSGKNAGRLVDLSRSTGGKSDAIIASVLKQGKLAALGKYDEAEAEQVNAAKLYAKLGEGEKKGRGDELRGAVRGAMGDLGVGEESGILGERLTVLKKKGDVLGDKVDKNKSWKLSDATSAAEIGPEAYAELEKKLKAVGGSGIDTKGEMSMVSDVVAEKGKGLHKSGGGPEGKAASEEKTATALAMMSQNALATSEILLSMKPPA